MNENMKSNLVELKAAMDEEFGTSATWLHQSGRSDPVVGIFSLANKTINAKSNGKNAGQLDIKHAQAFFTMQPHSVSGKDGDRLIIDGENYLVLPFNKGIFETVLPLKLSQNKDSSWR